MTGSIGARVDGLDLSGPADARLGDALRALLTEHLVLVFPGQRLDLAQRKAFTARFGPLMRLPYVQPLDEDPDVIGVLKEADERSGGVFGGDWHADFSFLEHPPAGSVLFAVEVPPYGGDTLWANQIAAYETLPADLRRLVDGRDALHTGKPYGVAHTPPAHTRAGTSIRMTRRVKLPRLCGAPHRRGSSTGHQRCA